MKKILIIDDETSILDTMKIILEAEGYEVVTYDSPPTLAQINHVKPDIIFLDLLLKGTNGKAVCLNLKGNEITKDIPVIMISAHTKPMLLEAANSCGAEGYLTKPFDIDVLYETVKKHTGLSPQ